MAEFPPSTDQACAIPFRTCENRLELCLITSLKKQQWIFPKGIVDPGETAESTALKESWEEAGLRGRIVGDPVGQYQRRKWGTTLTVVTLLMRVDQADATWPESRERKRSWMEPDEARSKLSRDELLQMLDLAMPQLTWIQKAANASSLVR